MTVKNSNVPVRKKARRFDMVRFEFELFDGVFELPAVESFDLKAQRSLMAGDANPLFDLMREAGVNEGTIAAIDSLGGEEIKDFMGDWGKAGTIAAPKSGG